MACDSASTSKIAGSLAERAQAIIGRKTLITAVAGSGLAVGARAHRHEVRKTMYPDLKMFIAARVAELDTITAERKGELEELAAYVQTCLNNNKPCRLNFICTHNSRRSQMAQVWAATAAAHHGITGVSMFSGGTEATAFNPRAVAALERAGFEIIKTTDDVNPVYHIRYSDEAPPMTCFSKVYNQMSNPKEWFCAVMTCSRADQNCPIVHGAGERIAITYEDPKVADDTPQEQAKYDERCRQIAREMLYVFSQVNAFVTLADALYNHDPRSRKMHR
jgi:arsenate reductase